MIPAEKEECDLFARLFSTEDGKRVLAILVAKEPPGAARFSVNGEFSNDPIRAAWKDGRASLIAWIHGRCKQGAYFTDTIT